MANPKTGLTYYTIDTDRYQDIRIKRLKREFKCRGIAVYDYILCEIYRVRGCFLVWDESTAFDVAEYFGLEENVVVEIVKYCGYVGLFNKELLSRGIITSAAIQRRYFDMCARARRVTPNIPDELKLVEESEHSSEECAYSSEESPHSSEECAVFAEEWRQSKVNKSKLKENNNSLSVSLSLNSRDKGDVILSDEPTDEERQRFLEIFFFKNFKKPILQVEKFVNYFKATGWIRKGGGKVTDRVALAQTWEPGKDEYNRLSARFLEFWKALYTELQKIDAAKNDARLMLDSLICVEERDIDKSLVLIVQPELMKYIERAKRLVAPLMNVHYPNYQLTYRVKRRN